MYKWNRMSYKAILMKISSSILSIFIIVFACLLVDLNFKNWRKDEGVIVKEVNGNYGYLPALLIFDDIKLEKSDYEYAHGKHWFSQVTYSNGKKDFGKTYGWAFLYSPFFYLAGKCALIFDYPTNGFSEPYRFFLLLGTLFYLVIGLDFIRKTLLYLGHGELVTTITLLILGLGTNLFAYSSYLAPMPMVVSFSLVSVFLYYSICWYRTEMAINILPVIISLCLLSVVYLPNSIIAVFFVLYGINNLDEFRERKINVGVLISFVIVLLIFWIPQFKYWKISTGTYLGLVDFNEHFDLLKPKFISLLFSFRNGWLVYSPLIIFSLIGMYLMKSLKVAVFTYILLSIYVASSWSTWWYGDSIGQSSMVSTYAVLAIPLAVFIKFIFEKNIGIKLLFSIVVLSFFMLNAFQIFQYDQGSLHPSKMTSTLYFKQFSKLKPIANYQDFIFTEEKK